MLASDPNVHAPAQFTSAFRMRTARRLLSAVPPKWPLRGYVLHMPCRRVVRDVYIEESIYSDATPRVSCLLPGARPAMRPPREDGSRHFTEVDLTTTIEQLPPGPPSHTIPGVMNHGAAVRHVLERTGLAHSRFRGWRVAMTYPVPLVEMMWWLSHHSFRENS